MMKRGWIVAAEPSVVEEWHPVVSCLHGESAEEKKNRRDVSDCDSHQRVTITITKQFLEKFLES